MFSHVVIFWTKPEIPDAADQLLAAARRMRETDPVMALQNTLTVGLAAARHARVPTVLRELEALLEPVLAAGGPKLWIFRQHYQLGYLHMVGGSLERSVAHIEAAVAQVPSDIPATAHAVLHQMLAWGLWRTAQPARTLEAAKRGREASR